MGERQQMGRATQAFIITVGQYIYCILKSVDGTFHLFHGHGSFKHMFKDQRLVQETSIISFSSLENLVKFIQLQRGVGAILAIAELDIVKSLAATQETEGPRVVDDVNAQSDRHMPKR